MDGFTPTSANELHAWLLKQSEATSFPLWVIMYKKDSGKQYVSYEDVVEEAICFGLIDSQTKTLDQERYGIALYARKQGSHWTEANKAIAKRLQANGRMTTQGLARFKEAS